MTVSSGCLPGDISMVRFPSMSMFPLIVDPGRFISTGIVTLPGRNIGTDRLKSPSSVIWVLLLSMYVTEIGTVMGCYIGAGWSGASCPQSSGPLTTSYSIISFVAVLPAEVSKMNVDTSPGGVQVSQQ